MKTAVHIERVEYIETPRRQDIPVKIDEILEARMRAFMRAKRAKRFTFTR